MLQVTMLTGAIFAEDRYAVTEAAQALKTVQEILYKHKLTGAVVGQQPGRARGSEQMIKLVLLNLLRWFLQE